VALDPDDCLLCRHSAFAHTPVTGGLFMCEDCKGQYAEPHVYTPYVRPDIKWENVLDKLADFYEAK